MKCKLDFTLTYMSSEKKIICLGFYFKLDKIKGTPTFNRPSEELMIILVKVIIRKSKKEVSHCAYGREAYIEQKS